MPTYFKEYPDRECLLENFRFDPETGEPWWMVQTTKKNRPMDRPAGYVDSDGYRVIQFRGEMYKWHRVLWVMIHGPIPEGMQVDHIDGNLDEHGRKNNRPDNLRLATNWQNGQNRKGANANSVAGMLGVNWHIRHQRFSAHIRIDGKLIWLGSFICPWEACHYRNIAVEKHFLEFGNKSVVPEGFRHPATGEIMHPPQWFVNGTEPPPRPPVKRYRKRAKLPVWPSIQADLFAGVNA